MSIDQSQITLQWKQI